MIYTGNRGMGKEEKKELRNLSMPVTHADNCYPRPSIISGGGRFISPISSSKSRLEMIRSRRLPVSWRNRPEPMSNKAFWFNDYRQLSKGKRTSFSICVLRINSLSTTMQLCEPRTKNCWRRSPRRFSMNSKRRLLLLYRSSNELQDVSQTNHFSLYQHCQSQTRMLELLQMTNFEWCQAASIFRWIPFAMRILYDPMWLAILQHQAISWASILLILATPMTLIA